MQLAKQQHEQYCALLREIGLDVIELPPDDALPEGVFVESSAVICNGVALIGRSDNPKRRREAETMAIILKKELDIPIIEIDDPHAQLDGGDVLFTGKSKHFHFIDIIADILQGASFSLAFQALRTRRAHAPWPWHIPNIQLHP